MAGSVCLVGWFSLNIGSFLLSLHQISVFEDIFLMTFLGVGRFHFGIILKICASFRSQARRGKRMGRPQGDFGRQPRPILLSRRQVLEPFGGSCWSQIVIFLTSFLRSFL